MALYSFCVKRQNDKNFHKLAQNVKYDLPFLDFLTTQFNNKEELLHFLGFGQDVQDIAITYKNNGENKKLDIFYAGALELSEVAASMVKVDEFFDMGETIKNLGVAYLYPKSIEIEKTVPCDTKGFERIYYAFLQNGMPNVAFRTDRLHKGAHNFYQMYGNSNILINELCKSYLTIRKIYMSLLENRRMQLKNVKTEHSNVTLFDIKGSFAPQENPQKKMFNALLKMQNNEYEDILINQILRGDCEALEELMSNDTATLSRFQEFLQLLPEYQAFMRNEIPQKRL